MISLFISNNIKPLLCSSDAHNKLKYVFYKLLFRRLANLGNAENLNLITTKSHYLVITVMIRP